MPTEGVFDRRNLGYEETPKSVLHTPNNADLEKYKIFKDEEKII